MNRPLKLHWFRRKQNFGDAISRDIVAHVSGRPVEFAKPETMELVAIGSILECIARVSGRQKDSFPFVWGTGTHYGKLRAGVADALERVNVSALRGPLTAELVGCKNVPLGDPGLLAAELVGAQSKTGKIGVIFHYVHLIPAGLMWALWKDDRICMIDVTSTDHLDVVRKIGSCEYVISSSLHGLIIADSFEIPNTWLACTDLAGNIGFKFEDYAGGVGRDIGPPLALSSLREFVDSVESGSERPDYFNRMDMVKNRLRDAFPASLRS